jgi:hypothetical protein
MKRFLKSAAILVVLAFVFAACEQVAIEDPAARSVVQEVTLPPIGWQRFTPLPFTTNKNITAVNGIGSSGTTLVAAGYDGVNQIAYASQFNASSGTWSTPTTLNGISIKPSVVHYLNGFYLVTAGSTSTTGSFSSNGGTTWIPTGTIGFGTKAGLYGPGEQVYVVAGQGGQAAYTSNLAANFTTIPASITGWPSTISPQSYINAGAYGNGFYVFGGGGGQIAYTKSVLNSVPWIQVTGSSNPFGSSDFINVIVYGNGTFVAAGGPNSGPGKIAYSTNNGQSWTLVSNLPIGQTSAIFALATNNLTSNLTFVAADDDGNFVSSTNGINWTSAGAGVFGSSPQVNGATYYSTMNLFFVGGGDANGVVVGRS